MNKKKFVDLIRTPEEMSGQDLAELQKVINESPYFQSAYTVMAKGCRLLKHKATPQITKRAAMYATNRDVFKGYLISTSTKKATPPSANIPTSKPATAAQIERASNRKAPHLLSNNEHDQLIQEIYENLEQWKNNRDHYLDFDKDHPQDIIIEEPTPTEVLENIPTEATTPPVDHVELLKSQVADEVHAEESEADKAVEEILQKKKPEEPTIDEPAKEQKNEIVESEPSDIKSVSETKDQEPEVESIEEVDPSSVYSFGKKIPEPEELPTTKDLPTIAIEDLKSQESEKQDKNASQPIVHTEPEIISSEELSSIVDESEALKETPPEQGDTDSPPLESIADFSEEDLNLDKPEIKGDAPVVDTAEPKEEEVIDSVDPQDGLGLIQEPDDVVEITIPEDENAAPEKVEKKGAEDAEESTDAPVPTTTSEVSEYMPEIDEEDIKIELSVDKERSTSESEAELDEIESQKKEMKLQTSPKSSAKKFRLSVLKRPINFTKPKKVKKKKTNKDSKSDPVKLETQKEVTKKVTPKKTAVKKTSTKKKAAKATTKKSDAPPAEVKKKATAKKTPTTKAKPKKATNKKESSTVAKKKTTAKKATTKTKSEVKKKPQK